MFWITVIVLTIYFMPTWFAMSNDKRNLVAIFIANVLLGWTGIGWALVLIWAACKD